MNAVPDPVSVLRCGIALQEVVEHLSVGQVDGLVISCYLFYDRAATLHDFVILPEIFVFAHVSRGGDERRGQYDFQIRIFLTRPVEQFAIFFVPSVEIERRGSVAVQVPVDVVDADEYRQHVGVYVQYVFLPTFFQIVQRVSADSPVEKFIFVLRIFSQVMGSAQVHESVSVYMVHIP